MKTGDYEAKLKADHPGPLAAITLSNGGRAYMRRPTSGEYDSFQSLAAGDDGEKNVAFARYAQGCFIGAIDGDGEAMTYDQVKTLEGPAFVAGGAMGTAVNKLSGTGEKPTRYF